MLWRKHKQKQLLLGAYILIQVVHLWYISPCFPNIGCSASTLLWSCLIDCRICPAWLHQRELPSVQIFTTSLLQENQGAFWLLQQHWCIIEWDMFPKARFWLHISVSSVGNTRSNPTFLVPRFLKIMTHSKKKKASCCFNKNVSLFSWLIVQADVTLGFFLLLTILLLWCNIISKILFMSALKCFKGTFSSSAPCVFSRRRVTVCLHPSTVSFLGAVV